MTSDNPQKMPLIIGHRGASRDAPENTLEAFRMAWDHQADGIEADFRLTVDTRIVCMHDETAARTAASPLKIADTPLKELLRLDAGSWKGSAWQGATIPVLDELLPAIPDNSWFFIELKSGPEIIAPLERVLRLSGCSPDRIRLLSFSAPLIRELKQQLPDWRSCWLTDYRYNMRNNTWRPCRSELLDTLHGSGANGLASADSAFLDQDLVETLRRDGMEIHVWTVDRPAAAQRLCALGVDSIMTNRPGWLRQRLTESP